MLFTRDIRKTLARFKKFPVIAILGPRQSGKTTFAQTNFKKHQFFSFEDPAIREFAATDPKQFLKEAENKHGVILDEFQYVPQLLHYLQLEVDQQKRAGYFVLTGSHNFLMNQAISQSLAGRVGILTLLALSINELKENKLLHDNVNDYIVQGSYPRLYAEKIAPADLYAAYIHTYIERDVRNLVNVGDLRTFQKFLGLCAGRVGQQLNLTDLAAYCGISSPTAHKWLSILEASYIVFLLQPYYNNFNKRLTRTPKLYFYDTGIVCNLLGITSSKTLALNPFKGSLFENFIISDLAKQFYNTGRRPPLYFWRDKNGRIEVEICLVSLETQLFPIRNQSLRNAFLRIF